MLQDSKYPIHHSISWGWLDQSRKLNTPPMGKERMMEQNSGKEPSTAIACLHNGAGL
jgi:hypothetical protein